MYYYIATIGNKYKLEPFSEAKRLRLDHRKVLTGEVYYLDEKRLIILTTLLYDVGQTVSIGGYPIGGKYFQLEELSITDNPVLDNAKIIEREQLNDN